MNDPGQIEDILMVEDNPGDVRLTQEMLKEGGYHGTVHVMVAVEEALDFLHQRGDSRDAPRPDIILLDWRLPDGTGEDVLYELNDDSNLNGIPVIVQTGTKAELDELKSRDVKADAYLRKPIEPDKFKDVVRSIDF